MKLAIGFLIVSIVLCVIVNVVAFFAEKVQKKKTKEMVKDNEKA